jgi:PGM1 C-terminal domain
MPDDDYSSKELLENVTKFQDLQQQLGDRWLSTHEFNVEGNDVLVVPSLSLDQRELQKVKGVQYYEERLLFSLIHLCSPGTRVIYITSQPIHSSVIDYFLHLLPSVPFSDARDRLILLSPYDSGLKPLSQKILERPRFLAQLRQIIRSDKTYLTCYNSTPLERELALQLNVPLFALDPDLLYWGTKGGSREIFSKAGIPHPDGSELVWTVEALAKVTVALWERQPNLKRIVIKLNEGFSGEGNAILDLRSLSQFAPGNASTTERVAMITDRFPRLSFQCDTETWENFSSRIPELGAIAEAFIEGEEKRSPSVQGCINPNGEVEILSTHDQILGGPDGQIFLGCSFPADGDYRLALQEYGLRVGEVLAAKGVLERFSVDFVAVRQGQSWELKAIEINIRKGGTTHPFMTLRLLTQGRYDGETGLFCDRQGQPKFYIATDNLQSDAYKGLLPPDLMRIIAQNYLHFDHTTRTGSVFHLAGCLSEYGKVGVTSIGNSPAEAEAIYQQVVEALDRSVKGWESGARANPVHAIVKES